MKNASIKSANLAKLKALFPTLPFEVIHIAGTNGKGSVATKIAYGLELAGYKVGLFTSPHINSFRERIKINGKMISKEAFLRYAPTFCDLSYFDFMTALALRHFGEEKVDYAVLETGMGGRLDATNIIDPLLTIITTISYDHTRYLGETLDEIAFEKAGIIKKGVPLILGPKAVREKILQIARLKDAPVTQVLPLGETYDEENSHIARAAMGQLGLKEGVIGQAIQVTPQCRFEEICPRVILDVAHNEEGLSALLKQVVRRYPDKKIIVGLALSNERPLDPLLSAIREFTPAIYAYEVTHPRLRKLARLPRLALKRPSEDEVIVICGSFYCMSEARREFQTLPLERDTLNPPS